MLKMLWTGYRNQEWEEKFREFVDIRFAGFSLQNQWGKWLSEDELIKELEDIDIFFVGYDPITENVLKNAPNLKLILSERDGPEENVDLNACERMGIPVLNSAGRCTVSVAELTFNLILNMSRPVVRINSIIRDKGWSSSNHQDLRSIVEASAFEVFRKTLGIVGLGRNGRYLAKLANGFGMNVVAFDPFLDAMEIKESLNVDLVDLDSLLKNSDYISILARVTPKNHNLIGKEEIKKMKPSCALVNTGRPQLLDYEALGEALVKDELRMAALDVFDVEPLGLDSFLYNIPDEKLILTSHIAGFSNERTWHQCKTAFENLTSFIIDGKINNNCTRNVKQSSVFNKRGELLLGKY